MMVFKWIVIVFLVVTFSLISAMVWYVLTNSKPYYTCHEYNEETGQNLNTDEDRIVSTEMYKIYDGNGNLLNYEDLPSDIQVAVSIAISNTISESKR